LEDQLYQSREGFLYAFSRRWGQRRNSWLTILWRWGSTNACWGKSNKGQGVVQGLSLSESSVVEQRLAIHLTAASSTARLNLAWKSAPDILAISWIFILDQALVLLHSGCHGSKVVLVLKIQTLLPLPCNKDLAALPADCLLKKSRTQLKLRPYVVSLLEIGCIPNIFKGKNLREPPLNQSPNHWSSSLSMSHGRLVTGRSQHDLCMSYLNKFEYFVLPVAAVLWPNHSAGHICSSTCTACGRANLFKHRELCFITALLSAQIAELW
jgi:hypothetical protein